MLTIQKLATYDQRTVDATMELLASIVPIPGRTPGARLPRPDKPDADKPTSGGKTDVDSGKGVDYDGPENSAASNTSSSTPQEITAPTLNSVGASVNRTAEFSTPQLQHAFKHAEDFGVTGNWNKSNGATFQKAVEDHMNNSSTVVIQGTYRNQPATHFYNPETRLNVIINEAGEFLSGWKLSPAQSHHVSTTGNLGGG